MITTIKNLTTSESIIFDGRGWMIELYDDSGITGTHTTYKGVGQIGSNVAASSLDDRAITIEGSIFASSAVEMEQKRHYITRIINPLDTLEITRGKRKIKGKADKTIVFSSDYRLRNNVITRFMFSVTCFNSIYEALEQSKADAAASNNLLSFPCAFPENGIAFGLLSNATELLVRNGGDIDTGCIITLMVREPVSQITVTNTTTGESITLNRSFAVGDRITINTFYGEKDVILLSGGVETSIIRYVSYDTVFFGLRRGDNVVTCSSDGTEAGVTISVVFTERYFGE